MILSPLNFTTCVKTELTASAKAQTFNWKRWSQTKILNTNKQTKNEHAIVSQRYFQGRTGYRNDCFFYAPWVSDIGCSETSPILCVWVASSAMPFVKIQTMDILWTYTFKLYNGTHVQQLWKQNPGIIITLTNGQTDKHDNCPGGKKDFKCRKFWDQTISLQ